MEERPKFQTLKEQFTKLMADHITVSLDDLTTTEIELINKAFEMFSDKLEDIKIGNDEIRRLSIELANLKAMGTADDLRKEEEESGRCPICQRDETYDHD